MNSKKIVIHPSLLDKDVYIPLFKKFISKDDFKKIIEIVETALDGEITFKKLKEITIEKLGVDELDFSYDNKNINFGCHHSQCETCLGFIMCESYKLKEGENKIFLGIKHLDKKIKKSEFEKKVTTEEINDFLIYFYSEEDDYKPLLNTFRTKKLKMAWSYIYYWVKYIK